MPQGKPTTREMSDKHEEHCAEAFGGRKHKASGSQWDEQADGSNAHDLPFAFRWDGKATLAKSHTITLDMLAKLREQSHGERPLLPLCWYSSTSLDFGELWSLVQDDDLTELMEAARETERLRARVAELEGDNPDLVSELRARLAAAEHRAGDMEGRYDRLTVALGSVQEELASAQRQHEIDQAELLEATGIRERNRELEEGLQAALRDVEDMGSKMAMASGQLQAMQEQTDQLRAQVQTQAGGPAGVQRVAKAIPDYVPGLPWAIINQQDGVVTVVRYGPDGARTEGIAQTVVVERSFGSGNRPRIILDHLVIPRGSLYVDGHLVATACEDDKSLEFG